MIMPPHYISIHLFCFVYGRYLWILRQPACGHWVWSVLRDTEFEHSDIWTLWILGWTRPEFVYVAHFDVYDEYVIDYGYIW